ncbi:Pyruvate kinase [Planctomycetales bacterium 10988]|nr:Pyruvate kinase [Planctomycetales bacterium 10988]
MASEDISSHLARTKIVATVGPACEQEEQLQRLVEAGVNVFRINMAHGARASHEQIVRRIQTVSKRLHRPVGILVDLSGPKIRLGELPEEPTECKDGELFYFIRGDHSDDRNRLVSTYKQLVDDVEVGDHILLADGSVHMVAQAKTADHVVAKVVQPGVIRSRQGVNLPGVKLSVQALTPEDRENAIWAAGLEIDFLGLSFVRRAEDIRELKTLLQQEAPPTPLPIPLPHIIAKIEKPEALENLESIVEVADGVMVARGDLGVEIDVARLAVEQKRIIDTCRRFQRPVIVATQMLDSMTHSKYPTRAEATDVANALLDGTDACMLSGETAVGDYPTEAVQMMRRISLATEPMLKKLPLRSISDRRPEFLHPITLSISKSAVKIAEDLNAEMIVVGSHTGYTAIALSAQRRLVPIIGISDSHSTLRRMCLYWGVTPIFDIPTAGSSRTLLQAVDDWSRDKGIMENGDRIVLVASNHLAASGHNVIMVHQVGS